MPDTGDVGSVNDGITIADSSKAVELANSSFEQGDDTPMGWTPLIESMDHTYLWETDVVSQGQKSLGVFGTLYNYGRWSSDAINVSWLLNPSGGDDALGVQSHAGYSWYSLTGDIKTEENTGEVYLAIAWFNPQGVMITTSDSLMLPLGDNDWQSVTVDALPPEGATTVRQNNYQTGTLIAQKKTEYDGMNRIKKVHSFKDNWTTPYATIETTYDKLGDIASTKDPRGLITNYTYDNLGRVTKQTLPDGDWIETRYNALSQVTKSWTSQNGTESSPLVSYTYDKLNRPLTVTYKTGESISNTYDKGDNLLTLTTNDGSQTYTYTYTHDQLNRLITRNDSLLGYKTFYEYDDASRRTRMHIRTSTGTTDLYDVTYAYDKANRLTSVRDVLASKTASYDYFDIGALKTATLPNGITVHRTLDSRHRLDELQFKKSANTVLALLDYTYDVKSNVTQLVRDDTGAGGTSKTFTFGYDKISRLTSANYGDETVSYTYDKLGNRLTQVSTVAGTTNYTIANNSNQLTFRSLVPEDTDFSTMSYTYDAEGKLTQRSEGGKSDAFSYAFGAKLKQIQKTRPGAQTQTISYSYDGAGKRVKVTDSSGTRYFLYNGGMPLLELDASKNISASYLYGADGVVYRRIHGATKSQDTYEYHHTNPLGSPIVLTNSSKNVVARYEYDVFGAIRNEVGTSDNTRKFTGKEFDADSNLYYYAARYYDPYIGRFTQRDPIGDGVNWYAYTYNNPLKFVDPNGLRALNQAEKNAATDFFGDMINLEQVDIKESGFRYNLVTTITPYLAVHNDIYGRFNHTTDANGKITRVDSTLIHELVHVWQYAQGRLEPVGGLVTHAIARATGQTKELYYYNVDHILYSERKTFREYSFEEQAAIMEDAYLLLEHGIRPFYNKDSWRLSLDEWKEYYEQFKYEFQQWHLEMQQSSSSSYLTHN